MTVPNLQALSRLAALVSSASSLTSIAESIDVDFRTNGVPVIPLLPQHSSLKSHTWGTPSLPFTAIDFINNTRSIDNSLHPTGKCLTEFDLNRVLGKGGFGLVVEACHKKCGKRVALKLVPWQKDEVFGLDGRDEVIWDEHPFQEVSFLNKVGYHSNIVQFTSWWNESYSADLKDMIQQKFKVDLDVDEDEDNSEIFVDCMNTVSVPKSGTIADSILFLQMELCSGPNLKRFLAERKSCLSVQEALVLFWDIVMGVRHVHSKGIVHRDVKPENIVFSNDTLKLIDFGLSAFCQDEKKHDNSDFGVGTPTYASPEQLGGSSPHFSSDIYSLGVILFEMLSHFSTEMERCMKLSQLRKGEFDLEPHLLRDLVSWMTQYEPSSRPSIHDVVRSVLSVCSALVWSGKLDEFTF